MEPRRPRVWVGVLDLGHGHVSVVGGAVPDPGGHGGAATAQSCRSEERSREVGALPSRRPTRKPGTGAPPARRAGGQTAMSTLGGYDPQSGRNAHEADKPTLIPVPSLLRSLLSDHLDPGYAAAAEARAADGKKRKWRQAGVREAGRRGCGTRAA